MSEIKQDAILSQRLLDAQVGVLGSMLIDPDTVPEVLSRVRDADFAEEKYHWYSRPSRPGSGLGRPLTLSWSGRLWGAVWTAHGPRSCRG